MSNGISMKYVAGIATLTYLSINTCDQIYNHKKSLSEAIKEIGPDLIKKIKKLLILTDLKSSKKKLDKVITPSNEFPRPVELPPVVPTIQCTQSNSTQDVSKFTKQIDPEVPNIAIESFVKQRPGYISLEVLLKDERDL